MLVSGAGCPLPFPPFPPPPPHVAHLTLHRWHLLASRDRLPNHSPPGHPTLRQSTSLGPRSLSANHSAPFLPEIPPTQTLHERRKERERESPWIFHICVFGQFASVIYENTRSRIMNFIREPNLRTAALRLRETDHKRD